MLISIPIGVRWRIPLHRLHGFPGGHLLALLATPDRGAFCQLPLIPTNWWRSFDLQEGKTSAEFVEYDANLSGSLQQPLLPQFSYAGHIVRPQ